MHIARDLFITKQQHSYIICNHIINRYLEWGSCSLYVSYILGNKSQAFQCSVLDVTSKYPGRWSYDADFRAALAPKNKYRKKKEKKSAAIARTGSELWRSNKWTISISDKTSYHEILQFFKPMQFDVKLSISLWNLAGGLAIMLARCLPNFRVTRKA